MGEKDKKSIQKNSSNMVEVIEVIAEKVEPVLKIITAIAEKSLKVNKLMLSTK